MNSGHRNVRTASVRIGTFVKTPSPQVVEVLGYSGLDFGIVDQEHAPFDRSTMDIMMLAGRAASLPLFVRVPDSSATSILGALDIGAAGLFVPHVDNADQAAEIVSLAKFKNGKRGFSNAGRWGAYGTIGVSEALAQGDSAEIFCMLESPDAIRNANEIAAVPGVAGLMIGRGDLAIAMGLTDSLDPLVAEAARSAILAGRAQAKVIAIVVQSITEVPAFLELGVEVFIVQSDQTFLRTAAKTAAVRISEQLAEYRQLNAFPGDDRV